MLICVRAMRLVEFDPFKALQVKGGVALLCEESQGWTCPYPVRTSELCDKVDQGRLHLCAHRQDLPWSHGALPVIAESSCQALISLIITFLCANGSRT